VAGKLTKVVQPLLGRLAFWEARRQMRRFHDNLGRTTAVQERVLLEKIRRNADSDFGRDHDFASIGSVGDAYDNALAETTIGLYKTEAVRADSPFRRGPLNRLADVEMLTADWVHWYNTSRLIHRLDRTPPVEFEARYYTQQRATKTEAHQ